ncbi:hypothetical protein CRG98_048463, partial [Punica granatum]
GGIEEGEDPKTAAFRELREETGVSSAEILAEVVDIKEPIYKEVLSFFAPYLKEQL